MQVGDGTTSVVVLSGELLREAEALVNQKIHPATIIAGYRAACEVARKTLEESAFKHDENSPEFKEVKHFIFQVCVLQGWVVCLACVAFIGGTYCRY